MRGKFQDLVSFDLADIEAAISRNDPDEIPFVPVTVALSYPDLPAATAVCIRLAGHKNPLVRGNAIMSIGHLARRFRMLDENRIKPLIEQALVDDDDQVRVLAKSAADEIHQFLHWTIKGHIYG